MHIKIAPIASQLQENIIKNYKTSLQFVDD